MGDIVNLGFESDNCLMLTPEQLLTQALEDIRSGQFDANQVVILGFHEDNTIEYYRAGIKARDCVLLCELAKDMFKEEL